MIKVNKIEQPLHEHFDPEGKSLGFLNYLEHLDLRLQIKTEKADGYYLIFNDLTIRFQSNGRLERWPNDMYDQVESYLYKLVRGINE